MQITCPHCNQPQDVADDQPLNELTCGHCGRSFNLISGEDSVLHLAPEAAEDDRRSEAPAADVAEHVAGGRFRVLGLHAQGGLGQVMVALDEQLGRRVAVKEIRPKHAGDPGCRERFVLEAEVTGGLEHPGIVPVYGLGAYEDGRPYYAMRFIRGEDMHAAIKAFHAPDSQLSAGQRAVQLRRLLRRFVDVCHAVDYAHSRGVLHRDIKPGNVMLGKHGETLVVDWGLAKVLGHAEPQPADGESVLHVRSGSGSDHTAMGSAIGTPAYMSPEQAAGRLEDLSPASDVYSLGATLYQLLTGQTPYASGPDICERVMGGGFPRPRAVRPEIPRPLEAICLKSMRRLPSDRYRSARDLIDDLERWMADEAVSAYRETRRERLARWIRRHHTWVLAATLSLLVVATTAATAAILVTRAWREKAAARQEAVELYRLARESVDRFQTGASEALKGHPGTERLREEFLKRAVEAHEQFVASRSDDVDLEIERGRSYLRLASLRRQIGDRPSAEDANRQAEAVFRQLLERHPRNLHCSVEVANCRVNAGVLQWDAGQSAAADEAYQDAITQLEQLIAHFPQSSEPAEALATALVNRADLLADGDRPADAERLLRRAVKLLAGPAEGKPDWPSRELDLGNARRLLGDVLNIAGRYAEAAEAGRQAVDGLSALVARQPDNPEFLKARANAALGLADVARLGMRQGQEAAALLQACADYQRLCQALPDAAELQFGCALAELKAGLFHHRQGATTDADQTLQQADTRLRALRARDPQNAQYVAWLACGCLLRGKLLRDRGDFPAAQKQLERCIQEHQQLLGLDPQTPGFSQRNWTHTLALAHSHLGQTRQLMSDWAAADAHFRQAIELLAALPKPLPDTVDALALIHMHHGELLLQWKKPETAREAFATARKTWQSLDRLGPVAPEFRHNLARFLVLCPDPAARDAETALEIARQLTEHDAPDDAACWTTLGMARYRRQDWPGAIQAFDQAIRLRPEPHGHLWFFQAMAHWQTEQPDEAKRDLDRGVAWMEKHLPSEPELQRIRSEAQQLLGPTAAGPARQ